MSRSTKWKLAIVAGISECLVYAEAKYCAFEIHGEPKYYTCPRTEYCCNFGCCVSPGFQIYHLWYYWLLVIIMFLVCSGGGWWYRYWLQGRYRAAASAIPTRSSSSRTQNPLRGPTCQAQQARISYNTARNTVLLHRMWKGPHRSATSPAYSGAAAASSAAHYQNTSVVLNDANCPYYQLYGPPPSYETVIAQTRGKISSPSSPELMRSSHHPRAAVVPLPPPLPSPADSSYLGQCYYNMSVRLSREAPQYQPTPNNPPRIEGFDTAEYVRLVQQYGTNGPAILSPRHQYAEIRGSTPVNTAKSNDHSEGENTAANCSRINSPDEPGSSVSRIDCLGSTCPLDRPCYISPIKLSSRIGIHGFPRRDRTKLESGSLSQSELTNEPMATTSSSFGLTTSHRPSSRSEYRKIQGGSLKIPRRREQQQRRHTEASWVNRRLSSADYEATVSRATTSRETVANVTQPDSQSNPSNNVILAANAISKTFVDVESEVDEPKNEHLSYRQQRPNPSPLGEQSSTNCKLESKRKLDRSRSLE